ncbi:MAG TPA: hypothetical protein VFC61_11730 [Blastocatellia bacterium]|jgi:hypothetical protein|nr:hypothetical protein [Blastocatellia bacterium]
MARKRRAGDPAALIKLALASIDRQIADLERQRTALAAAFGGEARRPAAAKKGAKKKAAKKAKGVRRKVSAATRKKLSQAASNRWARARGEKPGKAA